MRELIDEYGVYRYLFHRDGTATMLDSSNYLYELEASCVNDLVMWLNKRGVKVVGWSGDRYLITDRRYEKIIC